MCKKFIENYVKLKKRLFIRRYMRGFQSLKNQNKLEIISTIKNELSHTSLNKIDISSTNVLIFGSGNVRVDLILRQFLVVKLLNLNFNKSLLCAVVHPKKKISYPLPKEWRIVLEKHGFLADTWLNNFKWILFVLRNLFLGYATFFLFLWKSIIRLIKNQINTQEPYSYFQDLSSNNFPVKHSDKSQSHDIISWYKLWKERPNMVNRFAHSVVSIDQERIVDSLFYTEFPFPFLRTTSSVVRYFFWGIIASTLSLFDLFRGRFSHSLLLRESAKLNIVKLLHKNDLANDYLFHNSNHIFRPLWTYEAERIGSRILFYFYSTNCETFKTPVGYLLQEHSWDLMSWPNFLVWDQYQADFIIRCIGTKNTISIVGPIWFSTSNKTIPEFGVSKVLALFDVSPMRDSFYQTLGQSNGYNTPHTVNRFLIDVIECAKKHNFIVIFKKKRDIGNLANKRYVKLINRLIKEENFVSVDPDVDALSIISKSSAVISMPFTSTALLAKEYLKPTIYFDPHCQVQKDDRAAHGIAVITNIDELDLWLSTI